jgi:hypothetical protein
MQEFGFHPEVVVPPALKEAATLEMSHFMVSLIINQRLIGSGTLVCVDDVYAILSAHHVVELLDQPEVTHLGINIAAHPHSFFVPAKRLQHIIIGSCTAGENEELGPDLSLIRLLDPDSIATIKSKKSFYRIDKPGRDRFWLELPIAHMPWYLVGAPAERSSKQGEFGTPSHILTAVHFHGEATFKSRVSREDFDFVTLQLIAGEHSYPADYRGVSGGGVWVLPLTMDPDKGASTLSYDPPILAGVAFYQTELRSDERQIICHGPESIALRARDALRAHA